MPNGAGPSRPLKRLSGTLKDKDLARAVQALEDKIEELDSRLAATEKRLADGGL